MTAERVLDTAKIDASAKAFVLSRNPDRAMQEMMETIDALRTLYVEENDALTSADTKRFLALQERKQDAARLYRDGAEQMIRRRDEFKDINPETRAKFTALQDEFSTLTSENLAALARLRGAVQRLGDRIMKAARDAAHKSSPNYGARGNLNNTGKKALSIGVYESA